MANPLTAILPVSPSANILDLLEMLAKNQAAVDVALGNVGTVHFARFILFDATNNLLQPAAQPPWNNTGQFKLAVITEYDGDFVAYIQAFVNQLAHIFDALLSFTSDGTSLVPVSQNIQGFTDYVKSHDMSQQPPNNQGIYNAYPNCTVQQILTLECAAS
jgi:hypothetical protein